MIQPLAVLRSTGILVLFSVLLTEGTAVGASAAQPAERRTPEPPPAVATAPPTARAAADETRRELMEVLQKHPPAVARVLKLDPSLLGNGAYMSTYPALERFVAEHPEIRHNAGYYFENVHTGEAWGTETTARMRMIEGLLMTLAGFTAFFVVLGILVWLVRTVIDQRKWNRLSRIQAEVHSKLMDRFSSNDELMAYVQTPSGRRFLESGPSPLQEARPSIGAPFTRILWSAQIGVIAIVTGVGMLFVSGRTVAELAQLMFIGGALCIALGAGFTLSAAGSYALSRKLGLLDGTASGHA